MATVTDQNWSNQWYAYVEPAGAIPHIIPEWDLYTHYQFDCPCQPRNNGDKIVHNSYDHREDYAVKSRKPS